jgi:lipoprotein NlpD
MPLRPRTDEMSRGRARAALVLLMLLPMGCGGPRVGAPVEARSVRDEPATHAHPGPKVSGRAGESGTPREPGDWRPDSYTVRKGDTLYSIALDYGLDYRELASWNGLADPNMIHVDQKLQLRAPPGWKPPPEPQAPEPPTVKPLAAESAAAKSATGSAAPASSVESQPLTPAPAIEAKPLAPMVVKSAPKAVRLPYSDASLAMLRGEATKPAAVAMPAAKTEAPAAKTEVKAVAPAKPAAATVAKEPPALPQPAPAAAASKSQDQANADSDWIWPTKGPLLHGFNEGANPKGVAIGGEAGQPIVASAAGKVVYSGSGLRGYGKLIIIKHSDTYLSVYAHNRTLLVKEGERVAKGQKIAEMGSSDSPRVSLHFEIRRLGKPVDPLQYLPEGGSS